MPTQTTSAPESPDTGFSLPDGPKAPSIVNGINFLTRRDSSGRGYQRKYGDVWTLKLPGFGTSVFVADPALIKKVYTAKPDVLHGGEFPLGEVLGPGSLFSMDEADHLKERRLLLKPFHGDRLRDYESLFQEEALRGFDKWQDDVDFESIETFNEITVRVILRSVFGADGETLTELQELLPTAVKIGQQVAAVKPLAKDFGPWSPAGKLKAYKKRLHAIVDELSQKRLADPNVDARTDILSMMLLAMREDGQEIDIPLLCDELTTVLAAGHETTGSSLAWTMERLRRHPDLVRRLELEVIEGGSELRAATILEVLRSRPVLSGHVRMVKKPFELGEWRLAPGTVIFADIATIHSTDRYHADASAFSPDRYIGAKPDTYSWIPFGGGVRRCLGAAFAQLEMDVVIRELINNFELITTNEAPERSVFKGIASGPSKGGLGRVRRRRAPLSAGPAESALACPVQH